MDDLDWYLRRIADEVKQFENQQRALSETAAQKAIEKAQEDALRQQAIQQRVRRLVERVFKL